MKVLFIFKSENFLVPIGLCFISSVAKKEGYSTYLCEMNSQNPLKCISDLRPDVVAYSSSTGEAKHYIRLNQIIKKKFPEVFTIMGGPHPTFYPDLIYNSDLDAICRGEGEYAFVDTLKMLAVQKSVDGIPNIVTRNNRDKLAVRNLVEDLDTLPFPDFSLIYDNTPLGNYPLKSIITSRGCPYKCTYCFNSAWREIYRNKGKAVRRNSVNYVIDEIKYVKNRWPLSFVKFYDDIFTYKADEWLEEFSKKYKKHINLPFFILTRADLLTEDMVKLLKFAGCRTISMSIEAGNSKIRENMLKR
ncbi:MAG: B12-binding domain-containing radical SAM protein, partial [Candidatus Omnitrophica bacterium]|nr:B12-binding domain-containing radical SAM protein [Candidatus Omnitrophota bacterium]